MKWLLIGIALFMTIAILWRYFSRHMPGDLFRGLAWASFTIYLYIGHLWFLYGAIALFLVGIFMRARRPATTE